MAEKLVSEDMQELFDNSNRQILEEDSTFHRSLMDEIDWRDRFICIKGARGTGKTTMMRQRLKEAFGPGSDRAVYMSLDDFWFARHSLKEAVTYLYEHGFTHVFLDEVHHLGPMWSLQLKNIADQFRKLNVVYSGSSLLQMEKAKGDISRRQAEYRLWGLSFREYLKLEGVVDLPAVPLEEILKNHVKLAASVCGKVKILPHFETYLKSGFYPFYRESHAKYRERLLATVGKVLEVDYPSIDEVSQETIRKARKMLMVLSSSCPQTPNMSRLYHELETERNQGLKMLNALDRAGLLALVRAKGETLKDLSKPEKIYCDNSNLMHALVPHVNVGVERETFFFNQLRKDHETVYTGIGDFLVDGRWVFELGGPGKGFRQIRDLPESYVVQGGQEVGQGAHIPLWLFGFLY